MNCAGTFHEALNAELNLDFYLRVLVANEINYDFFLEKYGANT